MSGTQHELDAAPRAAISSIAFSPSGNVLAVSSWDCAITFYERSGSEGSDAPFKLSDKRIGWGAPALDLAWGGEDLTLYAAGVDGSVREIMLGAGSESFALTQSQGEEADDILESIISELGAAQRILSYHEAASNKVAYSASHKVVVSTTWVGLMHVYNLQDDACIHVILPTKPFGLSLTADKVVVAMAERKVHVYSLHGLKSVIEQSISMGFLNRPLYSSPWQQRESSLKFMTRAIATMPDGTGFATSSIEGRVGVEWFDPELQKQTYAFKCHRQTNTVPGEEGEESKEVDVVYPVNALVFHPVHGTFATGGGDGVVALWDAQTKRRVRQYPKLGASVAAMDFSSDGKFLAIAVSPGFEDGMEDEAIDATLIKVVVRELGENEAKGKAAK